MKIVVATILVAGCAFPAAAFAEGDPKAEAREKYERGKRAFNLGQYFSAAAAFSESYKISGDAVLLFNIGQSYRLADKPVEALRAFRNYLRELPDAPNRAVAEKHISELESVNRSPVQLSDDSKAIEVLPVGVTDVEREAESSPSPSWKTWAPWVGGGLTAAFAVGAIVSGVGVNSDFDKLKTTCGATSEGCDDSDIKDIRNGAIRTNWLWVLAGASAAAAGIFIYANADSGGVGASGRF